MYRTTLHVCVAAATLFPVPLWAQVKPAESTAPKHSLTFGVYSFKKPTDVFRDFMAAIDGLNRSLTAASGQPFVVNLRVFKTYEECLDRFVAGDVDFVRMGAASYVLARQREPKIELLVAEREDIPGGLAGVIAVRAGSPIRKLADLKGRSFAFGDENSTIGRFLSQAELVAAGVYAADLVRYQYLDRHDKVFKAVALGDFDAGALHFATFQDNNRKGELRELARFKNIGKPWIARAGLDPEVAALLRKGLLALTDKTALDALQLGGFVAATDRDYDLVRDGMKRSEAFLPPPAPPPGPGKD